MGFLNLFEILDFDLVWIFVSGLGVLLCIVVGRVCYEFDDYIKFGKVFWDKVRSYFLV